MLPGRTYSDGGKSNSEKRRSRTISAGEVENHVPEKVVEENEDTFIEEIKPLTHTDTGKFSQHPRRKGSWRQVNVYHKLCFWIPDAI